MTTAALLNQMISLRYGHDADKMMQLVKTDPHGYLNSSCAHLAVLAHWHLKSTISVELAMRMVKETNLTEDTVVCDNVPGMVSGPCHYTPLILDDDDPALHAIPMPEGGFDYMDEEERLRLFGSQKCSSKNPQFQTNNF